MIYNAAIMRWRPPAFALLCGLWLIAAAACGPEPDLKASLRVVPELSGYYDPGVQPDGENRLLPSLTFRLKNEGPLPINHVDLVIAYWEFGADGEKDSLQIKGIGSAALDPGQTSEPMTVRSTIGYKGPVPRVEFFTNSIFKGFTVKVFAKRKGKTTPLGEFPVDERILPTISKDGAHP